MGLYLFSNPSNENEIVEVVMSIHDKHEYHKDGVKWDRVYTKPTSSIDSKINPFDDKANLNKIAQTKGTLGDIIDYSAEQSRKRSEKLGTVEPKKKKYWENDEKSRWKKCLEERKHLLKEKVKDSVLKFNSKYS